MMLHVPLRLMLFNFLVLCAFFVIFIPESVTLIGVLCMNFNIKKSGFVLVNPEKNAETLQYIRKYSPFQVHDEYTRLCCGSVEIISIKSTQGMYFCTSRVCYLRFVKLLFIGRCPTSKSLWSSTIQTFEYRTLLAQRLWSLSVA